MKTMFDLDTIISRSKDDYRTLCEDMRSALKTLERIYRDTIEKRPDDTIDAFVNAVGWDKAVSVIATLVNRSAWDGRISRQSAHWAEAQRECWSSDCAERMWLYTDRIHMAHLDQLVEALRKAEVRSFVAGALYGSDAEPMTLDSAKVNKSCWSDDGVELPVGMTPYMLQREWNRQVEESRAAN